MQTPTVLLSPYEQVKSEYQQWPAQLAFPLASDCPPSFGGTLLSLPISDNHEELEEDSSQSEQDSSDLEDHDNDRHLFTFTPEFLITSFEDPEADVDEGLDWSDDEEYPIDSCQTEPWKTRDNRARQVLDQLVQTQTAQFEILRLQWPLFIATTIDSNTKSTSTGNQALKESIAVTSTGSSDQAKNENPMNPQT